jgi:hypothetical protein
MRLPGDEAPWRAPSGAHSGDGTGARIAQHVATGYTCCNMLHTNVATCCNMLQTSTTCCTQILQHSATCCNVVQHVACCNVHQTCRVGSAHRCHICTGTWAHRCHILHRDRAHRCHNCNWDWAHRCHICTGTGAFHAQVVLCGVRLGADAARRGGALPHAHRCAVSTPGHSHVMLGWTCRRPIGQRVGSVRTGT